MPTITVNVDHDLKARMETHPEINWSEVTRQAIAEKLDHLELLNELDEGSSLTDADVDELTRRIDERTHERLADGDDGA